MGSDWFSTWFNSHYYHILYSNRDQSEANGFMDKLIAELKPTESSKVLDLACGKGRHSVYLNKKGLDVTGVDLADESIRYAQQFENERLHFTTGDMRVPLSGKFDYIFNLFTSFGYFDSREDDLRTLDAVKTMLKNGGYFVLDFFNTEKVVDALVKEEVKEVSGINFHITRRVEEGKIIKDIKFRDNGSDFHFSEEVSAIYYDTFLEYFTQKGFVVAQCWGDYGLTPYDHKLSPRMIFCLKLS